MIDYSDWELRKLSVDAIRLDKQNPRLPEEMLKSLDGQLENFSKMSEDVMTEANKAIDEGTKLIDGLGDIFDTKKN